MTDKLSKILMRLVSRYWKPRNSPVATDVQTAEGRGGGRWRGTSTTYRVPPPGGRTRTPACWWWTGAPDQHNSVPLVKETVRTLQQGRQPSPARRRSRAARRGAMTTLTHRCTQHPSLKQRSGQPAASIARPVPLGSASTVEQLLISRLVLTVILMVDLVTRKWTG